MSGRRTGPILWCLAAAALFGAATPASKELLGGFGPLGLAGLLYLGAAAAVLPFSLRGGSAELRRRPRSRRMLLGAVLFGGGLGPVLLLFGLRLAPAASVSLWLNLETVATALLAFALFKEHLDLRTCLAAGLVVVGGAILAGAEEAGGVLAAMLVAAACLCWGLDNNLTALIDGFTAAQTTFVKGLVAGSVNLGLAFVLEDFAAGPGAFGAALAVGAASYGISIMLYIHGAQHLGATRSQILFSTAPFLGMGLSWMLLGEPVHPAQLAAAAVMGAALWLLLSSRHEHEHGHDQMVHTHSHRHDDGHHDHVHRGLPARLRHTHKHEHGPQVHFHPHEPDLHHRHPH